MSKVTKRAAEAAEDAKKVKKEVAQPIKCKEFSKNYVEVEEKEAESRSGEEDLKKFKNICSELSSLMKDILELKKKSDEASKNEISKKRIEASLLFVTLKKLNRLDKLRLKKARDVTHDTKQRVDAFHLQLENLLYEVFHLRKEVDKCLEFKSKDEEIELVSTEEFYREAPASISKPELTKNDKHKLTLARLEWEFEQRKRLSEQCRNLEKSQEKVTNEITQKQKQLESLLPKLNAILEASRPLQEELNLPIERIKEQKELAAVLPDPLYILYCQLKAFVEACDKSMEISIDGEMEEALSFGSKAKTGQDEILEDVDSDSDMETDYETNKRSTATEKSKNDGQLIRHPLRIQLKVEGVTVMFSYLTTLNIVTVNCRPALNGKDLHLSSMDNLLCSLFPDDNGDQSPNWVNSFQAQLTNNGRLAESGKPYHWAQRLAGLDFDGAVRTTPKSFINTSFVEMIVGAIRDRIKHRFHLDNLLHRLEKGELQFQADANADLPAAVATQLVAWASLNYEECVKSSKTVQSLLEFFQAESKDFMFFRAILQRGSAKVNAFVMIPIDYPNTAPLFSLELDWHGKHNRENSEIIRNAEAAVNMCDDLPGTRNMDLLVSQLKKLCVQIDLITEIDGQLMKKASGSWQLHHNVEFPAEKMIPQLIKGHNRVAPSKFDASTGFFLHR